jgi:hypothetical protein
VIELLILVPWSIWSKWYKRSSTRRPETSSASPVEFVPFRPTTERRRPVTSRVYVVNEVVNGGGKSSKEDSSEERENKVLSKLKFNVSDPATFGINWDRVPYDTNVSNNPVASISKLFILMIPILLVLLF